MKIQAKNVEMFRLITKSLEEKNTEFHTFRPKQVVLKGIHSSTPLEDIKDEIENLSHEILSISSIKQRVSKHPLPMLFVNLIIKIFLTVKLFFIQKFPLKHQGKNEKLPGAHVVKGMVMQIGTAIIPQLC